MAEDDEKSAKKEETAEQEQAAEAEERAARSTTRQAQAMSGLFNRLMKSTPKATPQGGDRPLEFRQYSGLAIPLSLVIFGLLHWALKVFVYDGQPHTFLFISSFALFILAGFALAGSLERSRLSIALPMFIFMVWYSVYEGNIDPGFLAVFIPVAGAILFLPLLLTKGASAKPELIGLLPVLFFFLDLGLLPWLAEQFHWAVTGIIESLIVWTPWWAYFGVFTLPRKGWADVLKVIGVLYAVLLLVVPTTDFGHQSAQLPGFTELSAAQERVLQKIPKGENKAKSRFICLLEEPTNVEECFQKRQEDSLIKDICENDEQVDTGVLTFTECESRERERLQQEQIQVQGIEDAAIRQPTKAEFKVSDYFPQVTYRRADEDTTTTYPVDLKMDNPRELPLRLTFSCHFKKQGSDSTETNVSGTALPEQLTVNGKTTRTTLACTPDESLDGTYTLVYEALIIDGLQTHSRLKRAFIGEKTLSWKEEWIPKIRQAHFPGQEHLSKAPEEFAHINFAFGKTLEDPIIEQGSTLFLAATIENNFPNGKIISYDYELDLERLSSYVDNPACLRGSGTAPASDSSRAIYLPTCILTDLPPELGEDLGDELYLTKEFKATLSYQYAVKKEIRDVKVQVVQS